VCPPLLLKITSKIIHGYTIKSRHPLFKSAVIDIDVLNIIDAGDYLLACGNIDGTINNLRVLDNQFGRCCPIGI